MGLKESPGRALHIHDGMGKAAVFLIRMRRLEEDKERMATEVNKIKMDRTWRHQQLWACGGKWEVTVRANQKKKRVKFYYYFWIPARTSLKLTSFSPFHVLMWGLASLM